MEKTEILNNIFSKTNTGIKLGLERMLSASHELGDPQNSYKIIHVAGTNGKGSVCTFASEALQGLGFKTGLYTSPHLIDFRERFKINRKSCKDEEWLHIYRDIREVCEKYNLTFFEISTLIAFILFENAKVDYAIIETGLGGRLDATNIVDPEISIITKIGIDHTAYLGDNIISIAQEKLGIIKENRPVVMMTPEESGIQSLSENIAHKKGCQITFVGYPEKEYKLNMLGKYQQINANIVLAVLKLLNFEITDKVFNSLANSSLPGRYDRRVINDREFLFDVSHNPQAVDEFTTNVKNDYSKENIVFVVGLMKDKDTASIINKYCEVTNDFIFTMPKTDRSELPENLASMVVDDIKNIAVTDNIKDAIMLALEKDCTICITGSFFTVGEAMDYLGVSI